MLAFQYVGMFNGLAFQGMWSGASGKMTTVETTEMYIGRMWWRGCH